MIIQDRAFSLNLKHDVLIIGAGPSGLFSAFQAGMLGMSSCIIDTLGYVGGQCCSLYGQKPIYDIPAHNKILAKDLISNLQAQVEVFNPTYYLSNKVVSLNKSDYGFLITTDKNLRIQSKVVIIAAGNGSFVFNKPFIDGLEMYENKSVFYSVDNPQDLKGLDILIMGGGDSAVDWALFLHDIARKVYVVHRREKFSCSQDNFNKIIHMQKIEILTPYQISNIVGKDGQIEQVVLKNFTTNEIRKVCCDRLLIFYGLKSELGPIKEWNLELENGKIKVDSSYYQTNISGIYAIGDIAIYSGKLKLILVSFAEAACALHHAYTKVFEGKSLHFEYSTSKYDYEINRRT